VAEKRPGRRGEQAARLAPIRFSRRELPPVSSLGSGRPKRIRDVPPEGPVTRRRRSLAGPSVGFDIESANPPRVARPGTSGLRESRLTIAAGHTRRRLTDRTPSSPAPGRELRGRPAAQRQGRRASSDTDARRRSSSAASEPPAAAARTAAATGLRIRWGQGSGRIGGPGRRQPRANAGRGVGRDPGHVHRSRYPVPPVPDSPRSSFHVKQRGGCRKAATGFT
jgi:hypothetical protein